jgi:transcriptional regulator with XRE-family HTH domain
MTVHEPSIGQFGDILRHWRKVRRFSQMDLALTANVSTRHLSFIETGRSQPGYDLVLRLGEVLDLPTYQFHARSSRIRATLYNLVA